MHKTISLNGTWQLRDEILTYPLANARKLSYLEDGWIPQPVPGDIHQGVIETDRQFKLKAGVKIAYSIQVIELSALLRR